MDALLVMAQWMSSYKDRLTGTAMDSYLWIHLHILITSIYDHFVVMGTASL
jgi:hypothetical protein